MKKQIYALIKSIFLICFVCVISNSQAQVIFQEDFDGISGSTAGGAGTYSFPSGWSLFNVDGLVPATAIAYINQAWERREDFKTNVMDSCAFSTSWYTPAGTSNDWMFTPAIGPLPSGCVLKWNASAYDPAYPDGYEVRIMTVAPNTGNLLTSTVLFSVTAENPTWTARETSLSAYAGMTVYIAFRNVSSDMFILAIDDISVEAVLNYDAKLKSSGRLSQYTMTPSQQATPVVLQDTIINAGVSAITNVQLKVNIYNESSGLVYSAYSGAVPIMAPGIKQYFSAGAWTPPVAGNYSLKFFPLLNEADMVTSNDTLVDNLFITDSTYARDNGVVVGSLGIGAGTGGYLGQQFSIVNQTDLRSVSYYVTKGYTGEKTACAIWSMNAGLPGSIIASTDTIIYYDTQARLYTLPVSGGPFTLAPGNYVITLIEFDSTLSLGNTTDVFTNGTCWVAWPGTPWTNVENFGTSFAKSYLLRPNLYNCPVMDANASITNAFCETCPQGTISIAPTGGVAPYSYLWNTGETTANMSGLMPGDYTVTITDAMNCKAVITYSIVVNVGIKELGFSDFTIIPNPNNGQFTVASSSKLPGDVTIEIFNLTGEKIYSSLYKNSTVINEKIDLSGIAPGLHFIRFSSANHTEIRKVIIK